MYTVTVSRDSEGLIQTVALPGCRVLPCLPTGGRYLQATIGHRRKATQGFPASGSAGIAPGTGRHSAQGAYVEKRRVDMRRADAGVCEFFCYSVEEPRPDERLAAPRRRFDCAAGTQPARRAPSIFRSRQTCSRHASLAESFQSRAVVVVFNEQLRCNDRVAGGLHTLHRRGRACIAGRLRRTETHRSVPEPRPSQPRRLRETCRSGEEIATRRRCVLSRLHGDGPDYRATRAWRESS